MAQDYSSEGLLSFLREETLAGRLHPATARSRRKAVEALRGFLDDAEQADLRKLDLSALTQRIGDGPRGELRTEVIELYLQRLASALEDYLGSRSPPAAAPAGPAISPASVTPSRENTSDDSAEVRMLEAVRLSFDRYRADVLPIPLARGRIVYLHGMPADLTPAEARKIARIVEAFASREESGS
jgi:hypothetical protein